MAFLCMYDLFCLYFLIFVCMAIFYVCIAIFMHVKSFLCVYEVAKISDHKLVRNFEQFSKFLNRFLEQFSKIGNHQSSTIKNQQELERHSGY